MTFDIVLPWKEFNVNADTVDAWMRANAGSDYCGLSANSSMQVHFTSEPNDTAKELISSYWDGLDTASAEATSYAAAQTMKQTKKLITASRAFCNELADHFEAENITLGINADDMVDEVLTVMGPTLIALQAGSPTAAIKRAKAIPVGSYDSKYVTAARLLLYVNQIEAKMGLTLSTSL